MAKRLLRNRPVVLRHTGTDKVLVDSIKEVEHIKTKIVPATAARIKQSTGLEVYLHRHLEKFGFMHISDPIQQAPRVNSLFEACPDHIFNTVLTCFIKRSVCFSFF